MSRKELCIPSYAVLLMMDFVLLMWTQKCTYPADYRYRVMLGVGCPNRVTAPVKLSPNHRHSLLFLIFKRNFYKLINRPQSNAFQPKVHKHIHHGKPPLRPPPLQNAARTRSRLQSNTANIKQTNGTMRSAMQWAWWWLHKG